MARDDSPDRGTKPVKLSDQERIELQRKTVAEHVRAESEHDYGRVNATFVQQPRSYYEIAAGGVHFDGPDGVSELP